MSKPFDNATKELLERYPEPWLRCFGLSLDGPVRVIDADLSTVSAEADKVFRIEGPKPYLVHLEMQASADPTLPRRLLRYNALLDLRLGLRVHSVAVLLRPEADRSNLTGLLQLHLPDGRRIVEFSYEVVRAWRCPLEPILSGSLGTLPMAPLADVLPERLPDVIHQIDVRLVKEAPAAEAVKIMEATLILAGLRLGEDTIEELRQGLHTMNLTTESSYYRLAIKEGRAEGLKEGLKEGVLQGKLEEARRLILRLGQLRFGPPEPQIREAIEADTDLDRLEQLGDHVLTAPDWAALVSHQSS